MCSLIFMYLCRPGEACSHIAAVISCLVRAAEVQTTSGATACTSKMCSWLPVARDVSIIGYNVLLPVNFSLDSLN